tara:strand:- start:113 stop:658 length:546 start_codon:yes stop_codon:yes gene_type:complete
LIQNLNYKELSTLYLDEVMKKINYQDYASVSILIHEEKEIIFIKRSEDLPTHKGHIAFPGGKREAVDKNIVDTALREAGEELLIDTKSITPVGLLSSIDTIEYKFEVFPVVCLIENKPISFNKSEVQNIYYVSIKELENKKNWNFRGLYETDWVFDIDGEILWGATAKMIRNLLSFPNVDS